MATRTIITCDRCGQEFGTDWVHCPQEVQITLHPVNLDPRRKKLDLCAHCIERVWRTIEDATERAPQEEKNIKVKVSHGQCNESVA